MNYQNIQQQKNQKKKKKKKRMRMKRKLKCTHYSIPHHRHYERQRGPQELPAQVNHPPRAQTMPHQRLERMSE